MRWKPWGETNRGKVEMVKGLECFPKKGPVIPSTEELGLLRNVKDVESLPGTEIEEGAQKEIRI